MVYLLFPFHGLFLKDLLSDLPKAAWLFSNPKEMPVQLSGDMSKQFLAHFPLTNGGHCSGGAAGHCILTMALCCQDLLLFCLQLCHCLCELLIIGRLSMPAGLVFHK